MVMVMSKERLAFLDEMQSRASEPEVRVAVFVEVDAPEGKLVCDFETGLNGSKPNHTMTGTNVFCRLIQRPLRYDSDQ